MINCKFLCLFSMIILVSATVVVGQTLPEADALYKKLTKDYNKELRPNFYQSETTFVNLTFILVSVNEFEERTNKLSVTGLFSIIWHDYRMMWNPEDYGDIYDILIPQTSVWIPDIVLLNPHEEFKLLSSVAEIKVRYDYNGDALWIMGDLFESTCSADVTYYPYDEQYCSLEFSTVVYPSYELTIVPEKNKLDTSIYSPNGVWDLKETSIETSFKDVYGDPQILSLNIKIKRKPVFFMVNIVIPVIIIGMCNVLVFLIPPESGERIGFSVTVLLAMSVFLTIISDNLPRNSEPSLSLMSYSLFVDVFISTIVTACTIVILRLYSKKDQNVPNWLKRITYAGLCCCCKGNKFQNVSKPVQRKEPRRNFNNAHSTEMFNTSDNNSYTLYSGSSSNEYLDRITVPNSGVWKNKRYDPRQQHKRTKEADTDSVQCYLKVSWYDVGLLLDSLMFVVFLTLLLSKIILLLVVFIPVSY